MDAIEFTEQARQNSELAELLQEVAGEVSSQSKPTAQDSQRFITVTGVDILFGLAAYALYRWLKDVHDHRRAKNENEILQQQERIVKSLIRDGFPPDQARETTIALLDRIAKRATDDPALKVATKLIGAAE